MTPTRFLVAAGFVAALLSVATAHGQAPRNQAPPPDGQRLHARDGDVVVVEDDARVRIVRRRQGMVRAVFDADQRWLIWLVDYAGPGGPDGMVDAKYNFRDVSGEWPLGARWEGPATVEDYTLVAEGASVGVGLSTPAGLVQLFSGRAENPWFRDPSAPAALTYSGHGRSTSREPFDVAERNEIQNVARNVGTRSSAQGSGASVTISSALTVGPAGAPSGSASQSQSQEIPVRVGGRIAQPRKLLDVPAVYPAQARQAGITGTVVLEISIGADGFVTNVRVLRSVPLLDTAALDAARQWRYEPTYLDGKAIPIVTTATVRFP